MRTKMGRRVGLFAAAVTLALSASVDGQGRGGAQDAPPATPRAAAAFDMSVY